MNNATILKNVKESIKKATKGLSSKQYAKKLISLNAEIDTLEEEIKRAENKLYYELPKEEAKAIIAEASKLPKQGRLETLREAYREYTDKEL